MARCVRTATAWLATLIVACGMFVDAATADEPLTFESARVKFSFGKVEALREGATEWRFVKAGVVLEPGDLVRMPPVSLLRLDLQASDDGESPDFGLVTGLHEASVRELVAEAIRASASANSEDPTVYETPSPKLPVGDPNAPQAKSIGVEAGALLSDADAERWEASSKADHPLVIELANAARDRVGESDSPYPPTRLRLLAELYDSMRVAIRDFSPVADLFYEDEVALMSFYPSLVEAAGIDVARTTDANGAPLLLIDSALTEPQVGLLTANRSLLQIDAPDAAARLRVDAIPQHKTFLEAWYGGAAAAR